MTTALGTTVREARKARGWGMDIELALLVTLATGLRAGELLGLQWADLEAGRLSVRRSRQWVNGHMVVLAPKTRRSQRTITLPPHLADWLGERRGDPDAWMAPLSYWTLDKHWRKVRGALGMNGLRWHDLRHTFASLALASGTPVHEVSAALGHERTSTTLDIYAHVMVDLEGRAVAAVATNLLQSPADSP